TEKIETGFELCDDDGHGETECSSYTNFKGKDGKIADFQIQGNDIADRLVMGTGEIVDGPQGAEIEFIASYRNASNSALILASDVRNGSSELDVATASYRNPDGRQTEPEDHIGIWSLSPESKSSFTTIFPV